MARTELPMARHGTQRVARGGDSSSEQATKGIREGEQERIRIRPRLRPPRKTKPGNVAVVRKPWPLCLQNYELRLRPPAIIKRTPPAIRTALTTGGTRSSWWV